MRKSIVALCDSAEHASSDDWTRHYRSSAGEKIRQIQALRDPICHYSFRGEEVVAVFGLVTSDDTSCLAYFWTDTLQELTWRKVLDGHESQLWVHFASLICQVHGKRPTMETVLRLFDADIDPKLRSLMDGAQLYWMQFGDVVFACVYRLKTRIVDGDNVERRSTASLPECLDFHFDYFRYRSPIWSSAPMRFLFRGVMLDRIALVRLHLHPRCFMPHEPKSKLSFLWPWQKCLAWDARGDGKVVYSPIQTTSLVFDLRKSTVAMEQLNRDALGRFSPFVKAVVRQAKEAIFSHGGFFDKETGDGLVAHFVDFAELYTPEKSDPALPVDSASKRAFDAAVEIVRRTARICDEFQSDLNFGVSNLGAAIGIHTGEAVWVCEENQVRAIGESVVFAARLCAEAQSRQVFISNSQFLKLSLEIGPDLTAKFDRQAYRGKERREDAGLFGYGFRIEDNL